MNPFWNQEVDLAISGFLIIKSPKHAGDQHTKRGKKQKKKQRRWEDPKPLATQHIGQKYENPFVYVVILNKGRHIYLCWTIIRPLYPSASSFERLL